MLLPKPKVNLMTDETRNLLILALFALVTVIVILLIPNSHIPRTITVYETHIVTKGESLTKIVKDYNSGFVSERLLQKTQMENQIGEVIMPGQKIRVAVEIEGR